VVRKVTPDGIITTVAGTPGKPGWSGDGGKATSAQIIPYSLAVDASGNLFIAGDFVVRKVTPDGLISTVAGRGPAAAVFGYGFSGDGGPATAAQLNDALRIALDRTGNLFILDPANQRVRKVAPDGIITTVAGSGNTPTGAMANLNQSTIMGFIEGGFSGDGGPGTSARLRLPRGIATDGANNVYVVDNMRIRKLSTGGIITTIAGNGDSAETGDGGLAILAGVRTPNAIAVDVSGNVFLAYTISRIRKVTPEGSISTMQITTAQAPLKAPRFANIPPLPWAAGLALLALLAAYTRMH
jgi:hypothetical protein